MILMTFKNFINLLSIWLLCTVVHAQQDEAAVPIQIRAILHDPLGSAGKLFFCDKSGAIAELELLSLDLSRPVMTSLVNGSLVLYTKAAVDLKKPEGNLAASCRIPAGVKRGIAIIIPSAAGTQPPYRMIFIDDSAKAFPKGESKILTFISAEAAIEVGEHKLPIHPGEMVRVPPVTKVNGFKMAQTNFYYKKGETWTVFTERQLQYLDGFRRIFLVYGSPGVPQPIVFAIVDTATP